MNARYIFWNVYCVASNWRQNQNGKNEPWVSRVVFWLMKNEKVLVNCSCYLWFVLAVSLHGNKSIPGRHIQRFLYRGSVKKGYALCKLLHGLRILAEENWKNNLPSRSLCHFVKYEWLVQNKRKIIKEQKCNDDNKFSFYVVAWLNVSQTGTTKLI